MNQKLSHALSATRHTLWRRRHVAEPLTYACVTDVWYGRSHRRLIENGPVDVLFQLVEVGFNCWHRRLGIQCIVAETSKQTGIDESLWRAYQENSVIFAGLTEMLAIRREQRNISHVDGVCERGYRAEIEWHKVVYHAAVGQLKLVCAAAVHYFLVRSLMAVLTKLMIFGPNFTIRQKNR